jgi:hypothetical protein
MMTEESMPRQLRSLFVFGPPVLVSLFNATHPVLQPPIYEGILRHLDWWLDLHIINLALFPLLGFAAYLLLVNARGPAVAVSTVAIAIYVPVYAAFDALAGIGTGTLVQQSRHLSPDQRAIVGGVTITPLWWLLSAAIASAMFAVCTPRLVGALCALAGGLFGASHAPPTGPLGAACFLAAALYLQISTRMENRRDPSVVKR